MIWTLGVTWVVAHVLISIFLPRVAFAIAAIVATVGAATLLGFLVIFVLAAIATASEEQ